MIEIKKIFEKPINTKDKKLTVVLSSGGVIKILQSSSLRVREVVKLKELDSDRRLIHIRGSKGKKDEYIFLSYTALKILKKHYKEDKSSKWLFEGAVKSRHISIRTIQAIFRQEWRKAEVNKDFAVHSLRHSFANHLLEIGVNLGYKRIKTAETYTYVRWFKRKIKKFIGEEHAIRNKKTNNIS